MAVDKNPFRSRLPDTLARARTRRIEAACSKRGLEVPFELLVELIQAQPFARDQQLLTKLKTAFANFKKATWIEKPRYFFQTPHPDGYMLYIRSTIRGWSSYAMGISLGVDSDLRSSQWRAFLMIPRSLWRKGFKHEIWGDIRPHKPNGDRKMDLNDLTVPQMINVYNELALQQNLAPVKRFGSRTVAMQRCQELLANAPEGTLDATLEKIPAAAPRGRQRQEGATPKAPREMIDKNEIGTRVNTKKAIAWSMLMQGQAKQSDIMKAVYQNGGGSIGSLNQVMHGLIQTAKSHNYEIKKVKEGDDYVYTLEKLPTATEGAGQTVQ
jgi:hypothetical protein